jgi:hypothetical protein
VIVGNRVGAIVLVGDALTDGAIVVAFEDSSVDGDCDKEDAIEG